MFSSGSKQLRFTCCLPETERARSDFDFIKTENVAHVKKIVFEEKVEYVTEAARTTFEVSPRIGPLNG